MGVGPRAPVSYQKSIQCVCMYIFLIRTEFETSVCSYNSYLNIVKAIDFVVVTLNKMFTVHKFIYGRLHTRLTLRRAGIKIFQKVIDFVI